MVNLLVPNYSTHNRARVAKRQARGGLYLWYNGIQTDGPRAKLRRNMSRTQTQTPTHTHEYNKHNLPLVL